MEFTIYLFKNYFYIKDYNYNFYIFLNFKIIYLSFY